jgi:4-hydroxy-3-methylbut-2-enyl diphosphate reductase
VILVGHAGHPEVEGTMGQVPDGAVVLVETEADVDRVEVADPDRLAFATQTTLSVADTKAIVERLQARFPTIEGPRREDICYATTNRQAAVEKVAERADAVLVVGAPNSSNSMRLVEVVQRAGCPNARLIETAEQIDWAWLDGVGTLGLTAGASAPEVLVQGVVEACRERFEVTAEEVQVTTEDVVFRAPPVPTRRAS